MGARSSNGLYGIFHPTADTTVLAHRWFYEQIVGPIAPGMNINHTCDFGLCENPSHHWQGTQAENVYDCRAKVRHDRKLEAEQVIEARRERAELGTTYKQLAARYGVTAGCIQHAVNRRTWGHL